MTNTGIPEAPRALDPSQTFDALVTWVCDLAVQKNIPGILIGISGTDSILTFLVCAKAFEQLGKPERVMGVHFGPSWPPSDNDFNEFTKNNSDLGIVTPEDMRARWPNNPWTISSDVMPWLMEQAPEAQLHIISDVNYRSDAIRWAELRDIAIFGPEKNKFQPGISPLSMKKDRQLQPDQQLWVAGTMNKTEQVLGTYSNASYGTSIQPLVNLWKSEVLQICAS